MSISVQCPGCSRKLEAKDNLANKQVKCPGCGQILVLPRTRSSVLQANPTTPPPKESALTEDKSRTVAPLPQRRPLPWLWYAAGAAAALSFAIVIVFIVGMVLVFTWPGRSPTSGENEIAGLTPLEPNPKTNPQAKPKQEPRPEEPEGKQEPKPEPKPEGKQEPKPEPKPETKPPTPPAAAVEYHQLAELLSEDYYQAGDQALYPLQDKPILRFNIHHPRKSCVFSKTAREQARDRFNTLCQSSNPVVAQAASEGLITFETWQLCQERLANKLLSADDVARFFRGEWQKNVFDIQIDACFVETLQKAG
jgi:hypothetical protein